MSIVMRSIILSKITKRSNILVEFRLDLIQIKLYASRNLILAALSIPTNPIGVFFHFVLSLG